MKIAELYRIRCDDESKEGDELVIAAELEDGRTLVYMTTKDREDEVEKIFKYVLKEDNQFESLIKCLHAIGATQSE